MTQVTGQANATRINIHFTGFHSFIDFRKFQNKTFKFKNIFTVKFFVEKVPAELLVPFHLRHGEAFAIDDMKLDVSELNQIVLPVDSTLRVNFANARHDWLRS